MAKFQKIVDRYVKDNDLGGIPRPTSFFRVLDVARKKGSGTGSLGLDRFWVLLEGWDPDPGQSVVIEFKKARRSALHGLVPVNDLTSEENDAESARRIVTAHGVHLVNGDPLYGFADIDGRSFLVRKRSPYKNDIEAADLDLDAMVEYAHICGQALAQPHARSDADTGIMEGNAEKRILSSIIPELFCRDVTEFAEFAADRIYADHAMFREDHASGAFRYGTPDGRD